MLAVEAVVVVAKLGGSTRLGHHVYWSFSNARRLASLLLPETTKDLLVERPSERS